MAVYAATLLVGCTTGIALSYASIQGSLEDLKNSARGNTIDIPTMLSQDGDVAYIDTHARTILLTTTMPYGQSDTTKLLITYDQATTFWDQFAAPTSITNIMSGSPIRISIERKAGAFYATRVVKL